MVLHHNTTSFISREITTSTTGILKCRQLLPESLLPHLASSLLFAGAPRLSADAAFSVSLFREGFQDLADDETGSRAKQAEWEVDTLAWLWLRCGFSLRA